MWGTQGVLQEAVGGRKAAFHRGGGQTAGNAQRLSTDRPWTRSAPSSSTSPLRSCRDCLGSSRDLQPGCWSTETFPDHVVAVFATTPRIGALPRRPTLSRPTASASCPSCAETSVRPPRGRAMEERLDGLVPEWAGRRGAVPSARKTHRPRLRRQGPVRLPALGRKRLVLPKPHGVAANPGEAQRRAPRRPHEQAHRRRQSLRLRG